MKTIIKTTNMTKKYGNKILFENLNLEIEKGKIYAITGPSGSGKSTLLNIIGGIETANSGEVEIIGEKNISPNGLKSKKLLRYKISYLFQNYALADNDTVFYNLELALSYQKVKDKKEQISKVLEQVGLIGYEKLKVFQLSGGEQQRVALARTLLKPTEIVLADEPTGNLDLKNRQKVFEILKEMNATGKTIIIVTHDLELASWCDMEIRL